MIQYNKSTIYKLCCKDANITEIYIGSTTNFRLRKSQHKTACNNIKNPLKYNYKVYKFIRENKGFENWDMIEIEKVNATDKKDLEKNERRVIEELRPSLNCSIPHRTQKEYVIINADKIKEYDKKYRSNNIDKIKDRKNEKIDCVCGSSIKRGSLSRHVKYQKHIKFIESNQQNSHLIFVE